jgi:uncharacterized membrane protein YeiH
LSYAAGNAGGVIRDLLIGAVPPAAISDWRYLAVSLLAGIVTFWRPSIIDRLRMPFQLRVAGDVATVFREPAVTVCWLALRPPSPAFT